LLKQFCLWPTAGPSSSWRAAATRGVGLDSMASDEAKEKGIFADFEFPKAPVMFSGVVGSPLALYLLTPARNALTIAAQDSSLSLLGCYRRVFAQGFVGGYTGGIYPAVAGGPQGLLLGPAYHAFASFSGKWGGVCLTGMAESIITYGAQTKNAQMAVNAAAKDGKCIIPKGRIQSAFNPFGVALPVHMARNILAMSGMRVTCDPITKGLEKLTGTKGPTISLAGDFMANIVASGFSVPMGQLYNYLAVTPDTWDKPMGERIKASQKFFSDTYLTTSEGGGRRLSPVLMRDFGLRTIYIAIGYTMFVNFERQVVKHWPF